MNVPLPYQIALKPTITVMSSGQYRKWTDHFNSVPFGFMARLRGFVIYLVNKANLVHNLFLVYLSISTGFGRPCVHHKEKQLCLCDTWYLLICVDDCLIGRVEWNCIPVSHSHRITSTKCRTDTVIFSWWWAHSRPKHVQIDKYAKN